MNALDIMDGLYIRGKFDEIMSNKTKELEKLAGTKAGNRKMMSDQVKQTDELNFSVKSTLAKIHAEQEHKLKSSKAYKKKEQCNVVLQEPQEPQEPQEV